LARELELPVVIGRAGDPHLLQRLSLERARALAAVTEDDLTNIAVAVATRTINEEMRIVLRVGDGEIANETRSLLAIGVVRDVHRIAAGLIASMAARIGARDGGLHRRRRPPPVLRRPPRGAPDGGAHSGVTAQAASRPRGVTSTCRTSGTDRSCRAPATRSRGA
jgi:voltage-gated potassium channel Kch